MPIVIMAVSEPEKRILRWPRRRCLLRPLLTDLVYSPHPITLRRLLSAHFYPRLRPEQPASWPSPPPLLALAPGATTAGHLPFSLRDFHASGRNNRRRTVGCLTYCFPTVSNPRLKAGLIFGGRSTSLFVLTLQAYSDVFIPLCFRAWHPPRRGFVTQYKFLLGLARSPLANGHFSSACCNRLQNAVPKPHE